MVLTGESEQAERNVKANAIIFNFQGCLLLIVIKSHDNVIRLSMANNVAHCLLVDAKQADAHLFRKELSIVGKLQPDIQVGMFPFELINMLAYGSFQPKRRQVDRSQLPTHSP